MLKNLLLLTLVLAATLSVSAQKKPVAKPATRKVTTTQAGSPLLRNLVDSASYGIGLSEARFLQQQGLHQLNPQMVAKAMEDVFNNRKPLLDEYQANNAVMTCISQAQQVKVRPAIEAGQKFLAENAKRPGVKTTASGLQYEVLKEGTGVRPQATDSVVCHYKGSLLDGNVFDDSYSRGEPVTFKLDQVIKGWTEALQLMPVGSKYKLYIPYQLAYGTQDNGPIPGGSTLVFEVELLDVKKP
ncbi:MAG TPA: FKBP-type peptidyl-prolyl cis-trans isomerase [Chitinophagaceae bacterium]|nr:FKBP-type peptidyl-prolyl cis-trans isomerase [Chitinophagaceae bacterium]